MGVLGILAEHKVISNAKRQSRNKCLGKSRSVSVGLRCSELLFVTVTDANVELCDVFCVCGVSKFCPG